MLKILVLGPPAILLNDKPLTIQRRQIRTLLYFLACHADGMDRGTLLTHFWPQATESDGRRQLRELISKLRAQIPDREVLEKRVDRIWLNKDFVYSDALHFQSLVQPAMDFYVTNRAKSTLPTELIEMMERAVALWRAPTFLAGARISNTPEFESWQRGTASKMELLRLQCLERLGDHYANTGDLDRAVQYLQKALEADTLNDVLQAQLLSLLYSAGRVSEAQTYYSYLMDLYQREYDDVPPPNIQFAFDKVSFETPGKRNTPLQAEPGKRSGNHGFIGRTKELEAVTNKYETGGCVFVTGELGVGKTRFVQHFCNTLDHFPRVMQIHCRAQDENAPLQPLINMIRHYVKREDWARLDKRWLRSLSYIIPDVFPQTESTHPISEWSSDEAREELFESLFHLFDACKKASPLILVFDDIQWCDIDTLHALMFLSTRNLFANPGLLILLSRGEFRNLKSRNSFFNDTHHHFVTRINLKPFPLFETTLLLNQLLPHEATQDFCRNIQKSTGGNPLFIIETLQFLTNRYGPDLTGFYGEIPLVDNLSEIIQGKIDSLSHGTREVLSACAVCGMEFQYDLLAYLQIRKQEELVNDLEELEIREFIHPIKSSGYSGKYAFNHNLIRDSVLNSISPARECLLHEKLAGALIALRGPQINRLSGSVARHFELAGKPVLAFPYWIKAGLYARGLFSRDEALIAFAKANAIRMSQLHQISESDLYSLYNEWGNFAFSLTDIPEMEKCYTAMYETGEEIDSPLLKGGGMSGLGLLAFYRFDIEKSLTLLNQSRAIIEKTDNLFEKIQVLSHQGIILMTLGQNNKAVETFLDAILLGEGNPNHKVRKAVAHAQCQLSLIQSLMGRPRDALQTAKAAQRNAYLLVTKPASLSYAHIMLALTEFTAGNFTNAIKCIRNSSRLVENIQNKRALSLANIVEARINCINGRLDTAWEMARKTLETASKTSLFEYVSESHCVMGDVYLILCMYEDAIREYNLAQENLEGTHPGINAQYRMGYALAQSGDVKKGLGVLDKAIESSLACGYDIIRLAACYMKGMILDDTGKKEEAKKIFDTVIRETDDRGISILTFIGSRPQMQNIGNYTENALAEEVMTNLQKAGVLHPGEWINRLIGKIYAFESFSDKMDLERIVTFLQSLNNSPQKVTRP